MRVDDNEGGGEDYEVAVDDRGQGQLGRGEDDVDDKGNLCCGEKSLLSFLPIIILIESPSEILELYEFSTSELCATF